MQHRSIADSFSGHAPAESETAAQEASALVARFSRMADRRGFREIRPTEVAALAVDLGYRSAHWAHGDGLHWLAAHLSTDGKHPAMPGLRYRNGFLDPAQVGPGYLCASLNKLLPTEAPS